jgi:glycolate oxidase FAD binding subunit
MKNVAGYDVSRLVAGSLGTLGLIAEASLKVLPRPPVELTLRLERDESQALDAMNRWAALPLPISATAWHAGVLHVRLSGSEAAVSGAARRIGGAEVNYEWQAIREQTHAFFAGDGALWRLSVPSVTAPLGLPGAPLIEWGGALRWTRGDAGNVRDIAKRAGGHATLFRAADKSAGAFAPLAPAVMRLHRALKSAFDPAGILNPGRLYPEL